MVYVSLRGMKTIVTIWRSTLLLLFFLVSALFVAAAGFICFLCGGWSFVSQFFDACLAGAEYLQHANTKKARK